MSTHWTTRERVHLLLLLADADPSPEALAAMAELRSQILAAELPSQPLVQERG